MLLLLYLPIVTISLIEHFEFNDTSTIIASTSSRTSRILTCSNAIRTWREAFAREGCKGYRPRRSTRSRGALLRRGVGWTVAKESDFHKERHKKSAMGWGVFIVIIHVKFMRLRASSTSYYYYYYYCNCYYCYTLFYALFLRKKYNPCVRRPYFSD